MARTRRVFPADFKAKIVVELLTGAASQALCRKYNLKPQLLGHWKAAILVDAGWSGAQQREVVMKLAKTYPNASSAGCSACRAVPSNTRRGPHPSTKQCSKALCSMSPASGRPTAIVA